MRKWILPAAPQKRGGKHWNTRNHWKVCKTSERTSINTLQTVKIVYELMYLYAVIIAVTRLW